MDSVYGMVIIRNQTKDGSITVAITNYPMKSPQVGKELLAVEVSIKQMINILWIDTFLMIFGFIDSFINYSRSRQIRE